MNNDLNNQIIQDENTIKKANDKKKLFSTPVLIFLIICSFLIILVGLSYTNLFDSFIKKDNSSSNNDVKSVDKLEEDKSKDKVDDNVYGYSIMSYIPNDKSWKEYYKIVELHKNDEDKEIVNYDAIVRNAIGSINKIGIDTIKIIRNRLYYQLYYNLDDSGNNTYSNIMYIDLESDQKNVVELLNKKEDSKVDGKTIFHYKIYDNYVYFSTHEKENNYYKYHIYSKKEEASSKAEFDSIKEELNRDYVLNDRSKKNYYNGKEIYVKNLNDIIYDNKVIYTTEEKGLTLYYPIDGNIIFSELSDCIKISCDTIKYYKINLDDLKKEEIDYNSNKIFTQSIWYKNKAS